MWSRKHLFLLCVVLLGSYGSRPCFAQVDIAADKHELEILISKIRTLDKLDLIRASGIDRSALEKGEFETTAQFDVRRNKTEQTAQDLRAKVAYQDDPERVEIYRQIDGILSKSYPGNVSLELGPYDADKQFFPLYVDNVFLEPLAVPLKEAPAFKAGFGKTAIKTRVGLLLDFNDRAKEYVIDGTINVGSLTYLIHRPTLDVEWAMRMTFGNFESVHNTSQWSMSAENFDDENEPIKNALTLQTRVAAIKKIYTLGSSGTKKLLVTISAPGDSYTGSADDFECHGFGVVVTSSLIVKDGEGWRLQHLKKQTNVSGGWCNGPLPKIVSLGPDNDVMWFDLSYMQMGYQTSWVELISISDRPFQRVAYIETGSDNLGAVTGGKNAESYRSTVTVVAGATRYALIKIFTIGRKAKLVGKRYVLAPMSKTTIYKFNGTKYEAQ